MIQFLDKETILTYHKNLIETYGGSQGVRDEGLLESALAQSRASFGGDYVHDNIFKMAAAYGFHIAKNHPFFDGNKRTALVAMYSFLYVNGHKLEADKKSIYAVMIDLANGNVDKDDLANFLKENSKGRT